MHPYMNLFGKVMPSYGLMAFIGCIVMGLFIVWRSYKYKVDWFEELYMVAFIILFALIGAKLMYQIPHLYELWTYPKEIFHSLQSFITYLGTGYVFYGGVIGGVIGAIVYAHFSRKNAGLMARIIVPGIPLFHVFGRIGCFMAGCCYGIAYNGPGAVVFQQSLVAPNGVSLLPTQLIEAGANVVTFLVLLLFERKERRPLQGLGLYLMIYSVERFVFEFFRGDLIRGMAAGVSTSQWISLVLLPVGIWLFAVKNEKNLLLNKGLLGNKVEE